MKSDLKLRVDLQPLPPGWVCEGGVWRRETIHSMLRRLPGWDYLQTKLEGLATKDFLPFNKGFNQGAGNPPNPSGLRTAYFWEETLTKASLSNIIENYAQVIVEENRMTKKKVEKQIFPRYHQLSCVRSLLADVKKNGVGQRYLVQHSAGSGKSNSIAWLAHQLAGLQDAEGHAQLDSVVVITDRVNLDTQIRDTIKSFMQIKNLVGWAQYSGKLKTFLEEGKRVIVTTIHKFGIIHVPLNNDCGRPGTSAPTALHAKKP